MPKDKETKRQRGLKTKMPKDKETKRRKPKDKDTQGQNEPNTK